MDDDDEETGFVGFDGGWLTEAGRREEAGGFEEEGGLGVVDAALGAKGPADGMTD